MSATKKVTISLPNELLMTIDRLASEQVTPRSAMIAGILKEWLREAEERLMKEGYLAMAEENHRLAEEAFPVTSEMLLRNTRWDDRPGS